MVKLMSVDCKTLRLPARRLQDLATELFGLRAGQLRFSANTPASAGLARRWNAVLELASDQVLAEDSVTAHPLLQEQLLRLVAITALHTFPNTAVADPALRLQAAGAPARIRRAAAFLEDNAHRPISTLDAAADAGLSAQALLRGFERHLGQTPLEYLRRVRLERAHRELQATHPAAATTVRTIAHRWGFADVTAFAARYRSTYGLPPHQTLRS
jgi:AraC-like DNA-binding protein